MFVNSRVLCNRQNAGTNISIIYAMKMQCKMRVAEIKLKPTRRMAIANGTCVSLCNQPKAKFCYLTRVTPVCRCLTRFAGGSIWLRQESLRHILASPRYAHWTIAVNVTWMKKGFNACQTHCSMYHLRLLPSNSTRKLKSSPF